MKLVLGVTGPNAAGKGVISDYLRTQGFTIHSLSDIVREESAARGFAPEREHLIRIGTMLREQGGPGILAERLIPRLGGPSSIRCNPAEVEAPPRGAEGSSSSAWIAGRAALRASRDRARPGDPESLAEFLGRSARKAAPTLPANSSAPRSLADRVVENGGDLPTLHATVEEILRSFGAFSRA
jgi:dephospho-CoA kinase